MPLTRPKSRNKSRSPAVSSPLVQSPPTPRGFLPPSHYAAAAGLTYRSPRGDPLTNTHHHDGLPVHGQPSSNDSKHAPSNPKLSYLPVSSSVSSSEQPSGSRLSFINRRLSRGGSTLGNTPSNRQSQLGDLPLVEAHLLPSLRDTIDRMTNPTRTPADSPSAKFPSVSAGQPGGSPVSSTSSPISHTAASPSRLRRPVLNITTSIPTVPSTPKTSSRAAEPSRIPTTTPKSKPKPALKSVLKSAASTSSSFPSSKAQGTTPPSQGSPSKGSPSKSLRAMRNLIGRKTAIPISVTPEVPSTKFPASYRAHERSRTDPGHVSVRSPCTPTTPQPQASSSSVPKRNRSNTTLKDKPAYAARGLSEDSGPEFELLREPRRALVVTNAEIVPSSSSSSAGTDRGKAVARPITPKSPSWSSRVSTSKYGSAMPGWETSKPPPLPERRVGLGFNLLEDKEENTRQGIQPRFHDHQSLNDEDGAESLYDDDDDDDDEEREEREDDEEMTTEGSLAEASDESTAYLQSLIQSRHVRFEQSGDERGRSSSSLPNPWDRDYMNGGHQSRRNEPSLPDGHLRHEESERRRRDALLGIVNELENGAYSGDQYTESDEPSDSEYTGQQGLAISPSTEFGKQGSSQILGPADRTADRAYGGRGSSLYFSPRARAGSGPGPPPPRDAPQPSPRQYERSVNHRRAPDEPSSDDVDSPSASEYTDDDNRDERFNDDRTPRLSSSKRQFQDAARSRDIPRARYSRDPSNASGSQHYPSPGIVIHPPSRPTSETILSEGSSYLAAGSHIQEHARDQRPPPSRSPVVQGQSKSFSTAIPKPRSIETPAQGTQMPGTRRRSRHGESTNRTSKDHFVSETYSLHENLGLAEAREREAFGLPLSSPESDRRLPQLDSASSIASGRWQDGEEEISLGAEAIFEQLASRRNATGMRNPGTIGVSRGPSKQASERTQYRSDATGPPPSHSQQTGVSETSSTYSIYQEEVPSRPWQQRERDAHVLEASETRTWRSTLSSSAYRSLLERYGETEMQRQEVIWEISEAEQTFVKRLRTIVHLFILPLRMKDSVTWLDGVPTEAARLFDWLEDIINLHSQISSSLRATISGQYPMVTRVAEVIRSFIPRLEVHQPYLVRVEEVALLIERMTREPGNDFGEFIRIQQEQDECRGWNIETFLVEPVNRLVEYPASFRRLWELTPRSHLDHLSTFSLLHSTETMIRVMREVKIREEEYELVKDRLGRIQGLPSSIPIASRERRLLARGRLLREYTNEYLRGIGNTEVPGHQLGDQYLRPPGGSTRAAERMSSRQSKLITALQSRNGTSLRSGSTRSTASSMFSADTHLTTSSSTTPPITPVSPPQYDNFMAPKSPWDDRYTTPQSTLVNMRRTETLRQSLLHTLVFSDLIILASSVRDTSRPGEANTSLDSWRLLEDVGISRILGVSGDADKIVLDLLPMDISDLDSGIIPESAPVTSIAISIPQVSSSGERLQAAAMADIRRMWVSAFQQCSQHTLRALSFPTQSGKYLARGPNVDWEEDSRQSVMAILASGLPLPKSPSLQLQEVVRGRGGDDIQQEREERGWWSLRFQQVLRELQRASDISANARNALSLGGSNGEGPRKRPGVSHPRPLRLSSLSSSESLAREEHPRPNTRN